MSKQHPFASDSPTTTGLLPADAERVDMALRALVRVLARQAAAEWLASEQRGPTGAGEPRQGEGA